ncbi:basic salivary proline-rich protein 4-like protein [Lates japonicus]|uniref:Basic salivary proline-rich protein 4-like protein n=1 Tax=Lates japonicus TaxID=270547 RepID=A0AAD3RKJ6_LATJO|nr:basic salivary proline-rich protein 4-like protein [Lates japonicus]
MAEHPRIEGQNNMHVPQRPMYRAEPRPPRLPVQPAAGPSWAIGAHQLPAQPGSFNPWLRGNWICPKIPITATTFCAYATTRTKQIPTASTGDQLDEGGDAASAVCTNQHTSPTAAAAAFRR